MIHPGGGTFLITRAAEILFERLEAFEAKCRPGYIPRRFADLSDADQGFWIDTVRPVVEVSIIATLTDMDQTVSAYDGSMGAAYRQTVHRYCLQELDHALHQE